jgi:hypothetical protein
MDALLREEVESFDRGLTVVVVRKGKNMELWRGAAESGNGRLTGGKRKRSSEFRRIGVECLEVFAHGRRDAVATKRRIF